MKKDKAVRKAKIKSELISKLKSLIVPGIGLLVVAVFMLLILFGKDEETEEKVIEVCAYAGDGSAVTMENDSLLFEMDGATTQFTVKDKKSGAVWNSCAEGADSDAIAIAAEKNRLNSTLFLTYSNTTGNDITFDNYSYSIDKGTYEIEQGTDEKGEYVKVFYSIGEAEKTYAVPEVISVARMDELLAQLDQADRLAVLDRYKKYDINKLGKNDDRERLLERYPLLETEPVYTLRSTVTEVIKMSLEKIFEKVGYTYEDALEDQAGGNGILVKKPVFNVNVIYRLDGGQLSVEVPLSEMEYYENYPVYSLDVLPYFGCGGTEDKGYLVVPEGGGGLINFNNGKVSQSSYYANMYGWDMAQSRDYVVRETETYFNAFGIAKNGAAFLCILEEGAPYARVRADISGKLSSYNFVSVQYALLHRTLYEMGSRSSNKLYLYEPVLPDETLRQYYRFIDSDDYTDMAKTYREYLQEEYGGLIAESAESHTPVVVEIVGAIDKMEQFLGVPVSRPLTLTTYKEAQEILERLNSDGVNNLSVRLTGWLNGGVRQEILKRVKPVSGQGSKKELKMLSKYAAENGIDLYLDGITNYAYHSNIFDGFFSFTDVARFTNKSKAEIYPYNTVSFVAREGQESHFLLKGSLIGQMVQNLVDFADKYDMNVSFADIGDDLSADYYRKDPVSRQKALENQVGYLKDISESGKKIMLHNGNDYAAAYSSIISDMNLTGAEYTIIDRHVPIYQMALHGFVDYTGESLNLTQNAEEVLLNSAEYGAGISFTLMDESAFTLQKTLYTQYFGAEYSACYDRMLEIYRRYDSELGHVFNQQMTGHEAVTDTLTCTEYEDGTKVYVNYGYTETKTPEGKEIPARDYLVVR